MDNFRRPPNHNPRRRSMDGFVPTNSFRGNGSIGFGNKLPSSGSVSQSIDDLKRPEGYHPASQAVISAGSLPAPLLDSSPRRRSKLRSGRGRRLSSGVGKQRSWWRIAKRTMIGVGTLVIATGLYFGIKLYLIEKNIFKGGGSAPALAQSVDITKLRGEGDGRVNILLLGNGGSEHSSGPDLTDTIMIASIDPINNQIALLSIPRDFWVQVPGHGSRKINEAYYYGKISSTSKDEDEKRKAGVDLVDKTLQPILGIPIHYHALVDFDAFRESVNSVNGIDLNVPGELTVKDTLWDEGTNKTYVLNVPTGNQHFDGQRALMYARTRYTSPRGDFDRSERQRLLLVALKEKVLSLGTFSNPLKVSALLDSLGDNVYTDFGTGDLGRIYQIASQIPSSSIFSLDLVTPPHALISTGGLNGLSVVLPKAGTFVYDDIQNYVRNALRDGFIQQENASVVILNGTSTAGLASLKSKELKSFGYNVTLVDDAPTKDYQHTILVDMHGNKKYTKNYLEKRLNVSATTTLPTGIAAGNADFVIILGSDTSSSSN